MTSTPDTPNMTDAPSPSTGVAEMTDAHIEALRGGLCLWHLGGETLNVPACEEYCDRRNAKCRLTRQTLNLARSLRDGTRGTYDVESEVVVPRIQLAYLLRRGIPLFAAEQMMVGWLHGEASREWQWAIDNGRVNEGDEEYARPTQPSQQAQEQV